MPTIYHGFTYIKTVIFIFQVCLPEGKAVDPMAVIQIDSDSSQSQDHSKISSSIRMQVISIDMDIPHMNDAVALHLNQAIQPGATFATFGSSINFSRLFLKICLGGLL